MTKISDWQEYLETHQHRYLEELRDFIRIPSVSALSEHKEDVNRAGLWVVARLKRAGIENTALMPTGGHPVVYGDWLHAGDDKPTILIYGHFDVQPADPFEKWDSPPFEPALADNDRVYGRGATDSKGNMLTPIIAVEALLKNAGKLPVNVKFLFEGQEEIGSPQLEAFIEQHADKLSCDAVLSSDGMLYSPERHMLVSGTKGLASVEIRVKGSNGDLHSGLQGGLTKNPIEALAEIIASMRRPDGGIAIEGFYDDVVDLSAAERSKSAEVPYDEEADRESLGVAEFYGEPGYTNRERNWARPTLDFNGIKGGFQGEGLKTVIPAIAEVKISCRLVANQTPERVRELIRRHVEAHTPRGVTVEVSTMQGQSAPYLVSMDHPVNEIVSDILTEIYGLAPYHTRVGGSVPVLDLFLKWLGVYSFNFGWSSPDENLHAPNEFIRLTNFRRGQRAYCMVLERLGELDGNLE
jgi:acetylornithine deacetylase/succinyl-diaminopimelate desuccinylase-like protein